MTPVASRRFFAALVIPVAVSTGLVALAPSAKSAAVPIGPAASLGTELKTQVESLENQRLRAEVRSEGLVFSGSVVTPGRYGGEARLDGDFTLPPGENCTTEGRGPFPQGRYTCAVVLLPIKADGTYGAVIGTEIESWRVPFPALGALPYIVSSGSSTTTYFQGAAGVGVGTYRWAIVSMYLNSYTWRSFFKVESVRFVDFLPAVVVPSQVSRAWRTDRSVESLLVGQPVTLSLKNLVTWSDGVVTEEPHSSSAVLQFRETGSGSWSQVGQGSAVTLSPTAPGDYRFLVDGVAQPAVFVNVVRPTSAHRVLPLAVSPSSAVANVPLVFTTTMETQYDDQVWRKSPVGTSFELQFLAEGGTGWSRLATERVTEAGVVSVRWPMLGSGRFRIVSGAATSESVAVTEVKPTAVVAAEPLSLPAEVFPGDPVDISVGVDVQYSDGVYRDAPDGTPFAVEFAESYDPDAAAAATARSGLTWTTQSTGVTRGGKADTKVSPKASGFWRLAFGQNRTTPVYLEVVGSKPAAPRPVTLRVSGSPTASSVTWTFTPVAGITYAAQASTRSGRVPDSQISLEQTGRVSVSGLAANTAVTVLVTGTDRFSQTDGGASATATTSSAGPTPGSAPGAVSAIQVSAVRGGKVTVSWSPPSTGGAPTSYQFRTRASKWSSWRSVTGTRVTITVSTRTPPTVIQIRAVNASGAGPSQQALL